MAHDGVGLETFAHTESNEATRRRLNLPLDKKIALYIGRLDGWKGIETLCEAAHLLREDTVVAVIGGEPMQVEDLSAKYPEVRFLGYRPYRELADNQAAADVLVLPNTGRDKVSVRFTSPLKLFTYLASGKPIVASDLPSIREVLDESMAYFFTPDDPASLARGIVLALSDPQAQEKARIARSEAKRYTWRARAERILRAVV